MCPIIAVIIMCRIEKEFAEALASGLLIGCVSGSIFGILALVSNKSKSTLIKVLSVIPICPLVLFAALAIPYILFR